MNSRATYSSAFSKNDVHDSHVGRDRVSGPVDLETFGTIDELKFIDEDVVSISRRSGGRGVSSLTMDTDAIIGAMNLTTMRKRVTVFDGEKMTSASLSSHLDVTYIDFGEMTSLTRVAKEVYFDRALALQRNATGGASVPVIFATASRMIPTACAPVQQNNEGIRLSFNITTARLCAVYACRVDIPDVGSCIIVVPRFEQQLLRFATGMACFECRAVPGDTCPPGDGVCVSVQFSRCAFEALWGETQSATDPTSWNLSGGDEEYNANIRETIRDIIEMSSSDEETKMVASTAVALIPVRQLNLIKYDVERALGNGIDALTVWTNAFSKIYSS